MSEVSWQTRLMERHLELFVQTVSGRRLRCGYPSVGDGWRDLVETAVARISDALAPSFTSAVSLTQIKEKFGTLRIYTDVDWLPPNPLAKVEEAIDLAEARSATTCEACGEVGRLYEDHGWYTTCCDTHARGKPVRREREIVVIKYDFLDGKLRVASCRRYDRDRDIFVAALLPRERRDGGD